MMFEADVIIPVYKPGEKLLRLLEKLQNQSWPVGKIILINTEQKYFDELVKEGDFYQKYPGVIVKHISKREFDHGKTRNYGVSLSTAPYFIMMTDDAVPTDEKLVENLLMPFQDEGVGMTYARQLPAKGCGVIESYTRSFNYPDASQTKSSGDLGSMGIKTFFASNVCAAYRRGLFDELGGFTNHTIFNEDMIYAKGVIDRGYKIAYVAEAEIAHSHNYSGVEQFKRNFDLGVSHAEYQQVFSGLSTESEGIRLVKKTCSYLCRIGKPHLIVKLVWQSGCKYVGYFLGKRYRRLTQTLVKACSMNREYWK